MTLRGILCLTVVLLFLVGTAAGGQSPPLTPPIAIPRLRQPQTLSPSEVTAFMGTWRFAMTNPQGSQQTVRLWDENGVVAASFQIGKFPPNKITGIVKDGDVLVLTTTVRENGKPIWAVIALTLDGQTMKMAQMLEQSETIKRGSGTQE
jgi:hypothetical protein